MATEQQWALEELVPHAHPMILVDRVEDYQRDSLVGHLRITEDSPFFQAPNGVPTYIGIEYVAQTVAALVGMRARLAGEDLAPGYLLGARKLTASAAWFPLGAGFTINVAAEFESAALGKFSGEIIDEAGTVIVRTSVTVYSGHPPSATDAPNQ